MTPYYQRPIELGVDIVVHSATKFLGGHSDVLAGLAVARTDELGRQLKQLQNGLGTVLGAQESWLLMRGMKTPVRVWLTVNRVLPSWPHGSKVVKI